MDEPTPEDMAALVNDGDVVAYLLSLSGRSSKNRPPEPAGEPAVAKGPFTGPLHRPGAWPSGTRPAGPNTCSPDCDCALTKPEGP